MQLHIGETWRIESDPHNFILQHLDEVNVRDSETKKKTDETKLVWKDYGFYSKLEHALGRVLREEIKSQNKVDIKDLINVIKNTEKEILKSVNGR